MTGWVQPRRGKRKTVCDAVDSRLRGNDKKNSVIPTSRLRRTPPREENLKPVTSSPPTPVRSAPPRGGVSRSDGVGLFFFLSFLRRQE